LLLQHCLHLKYFSLTNLNKRIRDIDLGHNESRNRPTPIAKETIDRDNKLGQRAAQAWCLAVNLPILIGQFVPSDDEHYYCFLTLLAILAICVATSVTAEDACLLATMTEDHHHRFYNLYPNQPLTPKMHNMVYLPRQLLSRSCICVTGYCQVSTDQAHVYPKKIQSYLGKQLTSQTIP
jgi:hypothetical protein